MTCYSLNTLVPNLPLPESQSFKKTLDLLRFLYPYNVQHHSHYYVTTRKKRAQENQPFIHVAQIFKKRSKYAKQAPLMPNKKSPSGAEIVMYVELWNNGFLQRFFGLPYIFSFFLCGCLGEKLAWLFLPTCSDACYKKNRRGNFILCKTRR